MLRFILQKLKNKKWLNFCLFIGIVLLCGMISCVPIFKKGSLNKLLQSGFYEYVKEKNEFPSVLSRSGSGETTKYKTAASILDKIDDYETKWTEDIHINKVISQQILKLTGSSSSTSLGGKSEYLDIAFINDMDNHTRVVKGSNLIDGMEKKGTYPCLISESVMDTYGLVIGEVLSLNYVVDSQDKAVKFTIVGITKENSEADNFWFTELNSINKTILVNEEIFNELLNNYSFDTIFYDENMLLNYTQIDSSNAGNIEKNLGKIQKNDEFFVSNMNDTLKTYNKDKQTVETLLYVLLLPVIILLVAFIYMVSNQILEMETGEIAMLKSRGISRKQIVKLYVIQSGILAFLGFVTGIVVGFAFCKLAAGTDAFLQFTLKDVSAYRFTFTCIPYGIGAAVVAVLFMTIPVIKLSKLSIVEQKKQVESVNDKPLWEKFFLDMILLIISLYLLYNYNKQSEILRLGIISGKKIDPVIVLDSTLFIFAAGLFMLRIIKYIVRLTYKIGKNQWKPAMYASFLQITRTAKKQGFISVFLVMTISMGVFNANMARTINQNYEERIRYNAGSDIILQENWKIRVYSSAENTLEWSYDEPDYERFDSLSSDVSNMTRVLIDDNTDITHNGTTLSKCRLMGINTKEFGETAKLKDGLNDTHWFNSLNEISQKTNGVIISKNTANAFEISVGDTITYSRYCPISSMSDKKTATVTGVVCGIVDAWPGFDQYTYYYDESGKIVEKENYLLVANYASVISTFDMTPYQVWLRVKDNKTVSDLRATLDKNGITLDSFESVEEEVQSMKDSALVQITNGMFTLSFLISIVLCSVGFLIYWIMSIKKRELLFGIYRAMGMGMKEINKMLINEQIFSSLLAAIAGGIVGILATSLFIKLISIIYLPENHNVPLDVFVSSGDMIRLSIVFVMVFVICFIILRRILKNMKIVQALKLGED